MATDGPLTPLPAPDLRTRPSPVASARTAWEKRPHVSALPGPSAAVRAATVISPSVAAGAGQGQELGLVRREPGVVTGLPPDPQHRRLRAHLEISRWRRAARSSTVAATASEVSSRSFTSMLTTAGGSVRRSDVAGPGCTWRAWATSRRWTTA